MKIGEFLLLLRTTKDTIRHYEDLQLLQPNKEQHYKDYGDKEVLQYRVIQEFKSYGLTLKEIQAIFQLKEFYKCKDIAMLEKVHLTLTTHVTKLKQQEENIHNSRIALENTLKELETHM